MKKESRKLNLNRETLATMQSDELEGVAGGSTPATISVAVSAASRASSKACIEGASKVSATVLSAISSFFNTRRC
jgi:hypothetical protein